MKSRPLISVPLQRLHIMCTPTSLLFVNSDCWRARNAVFNFYSPYYVKAKLKRPTKPIPARFRLDHAHTTDTASVLQGVLRDLCWSWKHAKGKVTWEGQEMQLMLYQLNHNRTIIITNPISSPGYFVNSTDEGPGPKRLEKNSNQNTAHFFIIFLFFFLNISLLPFFVGYKWRILEAGFIVLYRSVQTEE